MDIKFNTKPNDRMPCIPGEESKYNAVRLRDGTLTYFRDPDDEVRPVYTEVLVSEY